MNKDIRQIFNNYKLILESPQPSEEQLQATKNYLKAYGLPSDDISVSQVAQKSLQMPNQPNVKPVGRPFGSADAPTAGATPGAPGKNIKYFFGDPNINRNERPLNAYQISQLRMYAKPYSFDGSKWVPLALNDRMDRFEPVQQPEQQPAQQQITKPSKEETPNSQYSDTPVISRRKDISAPEISAGGKSTKTDKEDEDSDNTKSMPDHFNKDRTAADGVFNIFKSAFGP